MPANCTSKLQLADVALQRPFKHGITERFNMWAAERVAEQIREEKPAAIADLLKMSVLKPLILQWCAESWQDLRERKQLILDGWERSCTGLYDINSPAKRAAAHDLVYLRRLDTDKVPEEPKLTGTKVPTPKTSSISPRSVSSANKAGAHAHKQSNTDT